MDHPFKFQVVTPTPIQEQDEPDFSQPSHNEEWGSGEPQEPHLSEGQPRTLTESPVDLSQDPPRRPVTPSTQLDVSSVKTRDDVATDRVSPSSVRDRDNLENLTTSARTAQYDAEEAAVEVQRREQQYRLHDELAVEEIERQMSSLNPPPDITVTSARSHASGSGSLRRQGSVSVKGTEPIDEFDQATNNLHDQAVALAANNQEHKAATGIAKFIKKVHESSFLVRYFTYIVPVFLILMIPLLIGALAFPRANVGGVYLLWFSVWLEIVWLTLWAGRIVAKTIPWFVLAVFSIFTEDARKWVEMSKQLEIPFCIFFWWLGIEISFLPSMRNNHVDGNTATRGWERIVNKLIIVVFVATILVVAEKIIIQLIAMAFHMRTYADRIEVNRFQIGSLTKLYDYSRNKIGASDKIFETVEVPKNAENDYDQEKAAAENVAQVPNGREGHGIVHDVGHGVGYVVNGAKKRIQTQQVTKNLPQRAGKAARHAINVVGDVAGAVAGDFTGREVAKSNHPHQVVITLLRTTAGSQILARRLYRTYVAEGGDTIAPEDLRVAFDNDEESEAAFVMFDKDMNGDISMEELEAVCVEIGRERKSISASLKDLDSVVSKLDSILLFLCAVIVLIVFLSLISSSTAGVLASAGSAFLALSWLFSATAQELLQSLVFVFVKHPFDVGDRVCVYGNTGATGTGDDYFVKEISLLYTEFKKMEGHIVQAPNSYLNTLFILNQRRSGGLAEAIPIVVRFGTTMEQIEQLRALLLDFVRSDQREYQPNILTELRMVTENYSITLNVVFFYKSNWQNELLRLQRRNKFICHLMLTLQEVGIEGPMKNLPGARADTPWYMNGAPFYSAPSGNYPDNDNTHGGNNGNKSPANTDAQPIIHRSPHSGIESANITGSANPTGGASQSSVTRRRASTVTGSTTSRPGLSHRKRPDYSLGTSSLLKTSEAAQDSFPFSNDVYEDRVRERVPNVVRFANRVDDEKRVKAAAEVVSQPAGGGQTSPSGVGAASIVGSGHEATRRGSLSTNNSQSIRARIGQRLRPSSRGSQTSSQKRSAANMRPSSSAAQHIDLEAGNGFASNSDIDSSRSRSAQGQSQNPEHEQQQQQQYNTHLGQAATASQNPGNGLTNSTTNTTWNTITNASTNNGYDGSDEPMTHEHYS